MGAVDIVPAMKNTLHANVSIAPFVGTIACVRNYPGGAASYRGSWIVPAFLSYSEIALYRKKFGETCEIYGTIAYTNIPDVPLGVALCPERL